MTKEHIDITEKEFETLFPLLPNHINLAAGWNYGPAGRGCLFETYGDEYDFVRRCDPRRVWTVIDGENGRLLIRSGLHCVNRVGYLLSRDAIPAGVSLCACVPFHTGG